MGAELNQATCKWWPHTQKVAPKEAQEPEDEFLLLPKDTDNDDETDSGDDRYYYLMGFLARWSPPLASPSLPILPICDII